MSPRIKSNKINESKMVRYYFENTPHSYDDGGMVKNNYNQLIGRVGNEFYFLDYIFEDGDFKGATGTIVLAMDKGVHEYVTKEGSWDDYEYEEADVEQVSQIRSLKKFSNTDIYPFFEINGGGRIFSSNILFDEVYDEELYSKIKSIENIFTNGGKVKNGFVTIYFNNPSNSIEKKNNEYSILENCPYIIVPRNKAVSVIKDFYTNGNWNNYAIPELNNHGNKNTPKLKNGGNVSNSEPTTCFIVRDEVNGNLEVGFMDITFGDEGNKSIVRGGERKLDKIFEYFYDKLKSYKDDDNWYLKKYPKNKFHIVKIHWDGNSYDSSGYIEFKEKNIFTLSSKEIISLQVSGNFENGGIVGRGVSFNLQGKTHQGYIKSSLENDNYEISSGFDTFVVQSKDFMDVEDYKMPTQKTIFE